MRGMPQQGFRLRQAKAEDVAGIGWLWRAANEARRPTYGPWPTTQEQIAARMAEAEVFLVAEASLAGAAPELCGCGALTAHPDHDVVADLFICLVATAPNWQGRGVGRGVIDALMVAARERTVSLLVAEDNEPARRLYARSGFVDTGERRLSRAGEVCALLATQGQGPAAR